MAGMTLREKRQHAGRLGGLTKALNSIADPAAATQMAREAFMREFGSRHSCSLGCDVTIPPDLSHEARERAARLARSIHYTRLVGRREELRAGTPRNGRHRRPLARPAESTARFADVRPRGTPSHG